MAETKSKSDLRSFNIRRSHEDKTQNASSGKLYTTTHMCVDDEEKCIVYKAIQLKKSYSIAIANYNQICKTRENEIKAARFIDNLCKSLVEKSKKISCPFYKKEKEIWNALISTDKKKKANDYDETLLKNFIDEVDEQKKEAEKIAAEMKKLIESDDYKKHLAAKHIKDESKKNYLYVLQKDAQELYDVKDGKKIRQIDHLKAFLTEGLSSTENGQKILEEIINNPQKVGGFDEVWGLVTKCKTLIEKGKVSTDAIGKIIYNISPVIKLKINKLILSGERTIDDVINSGEIKKVLEFLDSKLDADVTGFIKARAEKLAFKAESAVQELKNGNHWNYVLENNWKSDIDEMESFFKEIEKNDPNTKLKKLKTGWFNITFDIISFSISVARIASDFKKAKFIDWCSALGDLSSMASTAIEIHGTYIDINKATAFGDDAVEIGIKIDNAANIAKRLGVVAGIFTAVVSIKNAEESTLMGDTDLAACHTISACLAIVGIAAIGTPLGAVIAVVGVIVSIWASLAKDQPVISYLKNLYWGSNRYYLEKDTYEYKIYSRGEYHTVKSNFTPGNIKNGNKFFISIEDTLKKYYILFNIKVSYTNYTVRDFETKTYSKKHFILIESSLLFSGSFIYIELFKITFQKKKVTTNVYRGSMIGYVPKTETITTEVEASLGQKIINPSEKTIIDPLQKNIIKGEVVWNEHGGIKSPSISLHEYWDTWQNKIEENDNIKYKIRVGIDPLGNNNQGKKKNISKMLLNNEISEVKLKPKH